MKTRMTELFGIKHPIMLAGMSFLTTPKLVAAVSNAGGLGILGGSHYIKEDLRAAIRQVREMTDKPFGVNLTLGVNTKELVPVVLEEKVPVLNYALGRPPEISPLIKAVHEYGGKVIGTVALARHGARSEQLGADMLNITGYEAAAHSGNVGAVVLIPITTKTVKVPCTAAGGFADGRGLAAALALGAEGITMGTRLAATKDSEAPDTIKQVWLKANEEDTIIDPAFDGINCRVLRNKAAEEMLKKRFPLIDAMVAGMRLKKTLKLTYPQMIRTAANLKNQEIGIGGGKRSLTSVMRFAAGAELFQKAELHGDAESGILMCGQVVGMIRDLPTVAEVIQRTVAEAEQVMKSMVSRIGG